MTLDVAADVHLIRDDLLRASSSPASQQAHPTRASIALRARTPRTQLSPYAPRAHWRPRFLGRFQVRAPTLGLWLSPKPSRCALDARDLRLSPKLSRTRPLRPPFAFASGPASLASRASLTLADARCALAVGSRRARAPRSLAARVASLAVFTLRCSRRARVRSRLGFAPFEAKPSAVAFAYPGSGSIFIELPGWPGCRPFLRGPFGPRVPARVRAKIALHTSASCSSPPLRRLRSRSRFILLLQESAFAYRPPFGVRTRRKLTVREATLLAPSISTRRAQTVLQVRSPATDSPILSDRSTCREQTILQACSPMTGAPILSDRSTGRERAVLSARSTRSDVTLLAEDTPRDRVSSFRLPTSEAFASGSRARATALVRLQRIAIEHARLFRLRFNRPARAFEPSSRGSDPRSARTLRLAPPSPTIPLHGAALAFPTFAFARANSSRHSPARRAIVAPHSRGKTALTAAARFGFTPLSRRAASAGPPCSRRTAFAAHPVRRAAFASHRKSVTPRFRGPSRL